MIIETLITLVYAETNGQGLASIPLFWCPHAVACSNLTKSRHPTFESRTH